MRVADRQVVITGASSGIGAALAREVARRGGRLVLAARRRDRLDALVRSLRRAGAVAYPVACDVTRRDQVRGLIEQARARLGRIDVLVNNAGISAYGATERTTIADFERLFAVNLLGPWHGMAEVIPVMRRQGGGVIVNVASVAALHGVPYLGAYAASKAALVALTQSLRAELAADGIRLLIAYPGYTETEIYARERRLGGARRPRGGYASADRVARAIVRGIERGRHELVLSGGGRALAALKRLAPPLADVVMRRVAVNLSEPVEVTHVETQAADHRPVPEPR